LCSSWCAYEGGDKGKEGGECQLPLNEWAWESRLCQKQKVLKMSEKLHADRALFGWRFIIFYFFYPFSLWGCFFLLYSHCLCLTQLSHFYQKPVLLMQLF
jgi:hypothetical protein